MLSEPPRLRDICIAPTSCLASLGTPQTGPERADAPPGGQGGPGHVIYASEGILVLVKKTRLYFQLYC